MGPREFTAPNFTRNHQQELTPNVDFKNMQKVVIEKMYEEKIKFEQT